MAHMGGWGGFDKDTEEVFRLLYACRSSQELYFDISAVLSSKKKASQPEEIRKPEAELTTLAKAIKELGTERILFGTDWPVVDIDEYVKLLNSELGDLDTNKILENKVPKN